MIINTNKIITHINSDTRVKQEVFTIFSIFQSNKSRSFCNREIKDLLQLDDKVSFRYLNQLVSYGYLSKTKDKDTIVYRFASTNGREKLKSTKL